jgi:hypothetical protein
VKTRLVNRGGPQTFTSLTVTGVASFADGAVGAPSVTFTSDPDSGLYRIGANNIGVAVNGAKVLDIATTGLTVTGSLNVANNNGIDFNGGAGGPTIRRDGATGDLVMTNLAGANIFLDGSVKFGTYTAGAAVTSTGFITIKDAGGTDRKVMIQA